MEAGNLTGIIPCVILVFRRVTIDAISFAAVPAEPFRHGLNLNGSWWSGTSGHVRCTGKLPNRLKSQIIIHATLVSVGLVKHDAQFVLFPFASIIAYSISLAARHL